MTNQCRGGFFDLETECSVAHSTFKVGDRVQRLMNVFDIRKSKMKYGKVVRVYAKPNCRFGPYPELYEVQWDDGTKGSGYLPHGLHLSVVDGNGVVQK